jgi:hypothetical protein
LVTLGVPDDVVKKAVVAAKKVHEEFYLAEAMNYWVSNSPTLVRVSHPSRYKRHKFYVSNDNDRGRTKIQNWKNRYNNTIEFKREWVLRSIEERKAKVVEWCKFGTEEEQRRHQGRLRKFIDESYTKNLWKSWEAGASSYYVDWDRRVNISKWYEGIHPGRFFLFYRKNKIIEKRNRGLPSGPCEDGYKYPKTPIFDWGPYEQLIEDLRCIDGPGLCESGSKVEHIDDIFSQ